MNDAIATLLEAQKKALAGRPKVGGFPYLAEVLRQAGVEKNEWQLPACQATYRTVRGPVIVPGTPLVTGPAAVPRFDEKALVEAIRRDQAGRSTFPEFLLAAWQAGVVRYEVDLLARHVCYFGIDGSSYREAYPAVPVSR